MRIHTPFHPFQRHPFSAHAVEIGNLLIILLGIALVLLFRPFQY
jgi:hypothetical protein